MLPLEGAVTKRALPGQSTTDQSIKCQSTAFQDNFHCDPAEGALPSSVPAQKLHHYVLTI